MVQTQAAETKTDATVNALLDCMLDLFRGGRWYSGDWRAMIDIDTEGKELPPITAYCLLGGAKHCAGAGDRDVYGSWSNRQYEEALLLLYRTAVKSGRIKVAARYGDVGDIHVDVPLGEEDLETDFDNIQDQLIGWNDKTGRTVEEVIALVAEAKALADLDAAVVA